MPGLHPQTRQGTTDVAGADDADPRYVLRVLGLQQVARQQQADAQQAGGKPLGRCFHRLLLIHGEAANIGRPHNLEKA
ncbi:hypothetical protein D9M68_942650 [compost metagenome]